MAKYDAKTDTQIVDLGTLALSGTTPAVSAYVDTAGFQACTIYIRNNTVTDAGTAAGFTATLQDTDATTAVSAASVTAANSVDGVVTVVVTSDTADDSMAGVLGYVGGKRYVGVSVVGTSGTDAGVVVFAVLSRPASAKTVAIGAKVART